MEHYVENDNNKIAFNIRRLIYFINKLFIKKKKIFLYVFFYELTIKVREREKNMFNIYNELFNDYKKKEKKLNELEYKFNKSEEKLYTFSPRINNGIKIKKSFSKNSNKNKSFEINIKNPLYGYSYRNNNIKYFNPISDSLYNINDDIIKYETIDNERNNKIIINFLNNSRKDNNHNNNLFNDKYMNNKNKYKNYFLLNTSRENDKNKSNTLEVRKNVNNENNFSKELSGQKSSKKRKEYFLKSNQDIPSKYNKETIDYTEYSGPIIKNVSENKYNTINASEQRNLNLFNDKKLSLKNKINKDIKFKSLQNSNSNIKENHIYKTFGKKPNEESKDNNYFYTFRKEKIKYNSFNNSSKKKQKNLIPYNFKNNIKKNKKSKIPISLRDNSKFHSFNSITTMNQIYLNNYHNRICSIKKSEHDYNINNKSSTNNSSKNSKNKISLLDITSKKESTRHQSITNLISNNNDIKGYNTSVSSLNNPITIKSKTKKHIVDSTIRKSTKKLTYSSNTTDKKNLGNKKIVPNLEFNKFEIVNECKMNLENKRDFQNNKNNKNIKSEKSMTLQSLSDSKMMELAEYYINNGEDSFEELDLKFMELKKNMKKEKEYKNITFG